MVGHKNAEGKNEYSIYDFFRGHPGAFAACISGIVAVLSFVFNFAVSRYNYAYLGYWRIDPIYASDIGKGNVYLVLASFLYTIALMIIHAFLSETVDALISYREKQKIFRQSYKKIKRVQKEIKKTKRLARKSLKRIKIVLN